MPRLVIDASIAGAWCFPDEETEYTRAALRIVGDTLDPVAPSLWLYEIHNTLLVGLRRGRITSEDAQKLMVFVSDLNVQILDPAPPEAIFELARKHVLTFYDAAYLELALRERLPLASLDKTLCKAAESAGVALFRPSTDEPPRNKQ